ncbi:hypothetical protein GF312_14995 [Candidatus Poribacteria bacterium]|nr:hypothetical protein [Candidatus Poribacteria bacterium]
MKRLLFLPLAFVTLLLFVFPAFAEPSLLDDHKFSSAIFQIKPTNDIVSETISINKQKSPAKAFLFSAVVPGTGELYSKAKRGIIFMAAEVALWVTYFVMNGQAEDLKADYVAYVDEHIVFEDDSPVYSTETWTLEDYEHATQSDNWHYVYTENNGQPLTRVGKYYWKDLPEEKIDAPGGISLSESESQYRIEAFNKRTDMNDKFKQSKVFIGLVVINHIVSAIDARIAATIYNKQNNKADVSFSLLPMMSNSRDTNAMLNMSGRF